MKLKNILIVVSNIEKSKAFYRDIFGFSVVTDLGENVILTEGLVLQEKKTWEKLIGKESFGKSNNTELYFEETNMDAFLEKLQKSEYQIEYINEITASDLGQRVIRIYDPDGHIIEVKDKGDING